jgi:hypothetical protein
VSIDNSVDHVLLMSVPRIATPCSDLDDLEVKHIITGESTYIINLSDCATKEQNGELLELQFWLSYVQHFGQQMQDDWFVIRLGTA